VKERDIIFRNDSAFVELKSDEGEHDEFLVQTGISDGIDIEVTEGLDTTQQIKVQQIVADNSK
jgi:HlyD family secretion protein